MKEGETEEDVDVNIEVVRDFAEYDSGGKHSSFKMDDLEHPSHRSLAGGGRHRGPMKNHAT
jgi:hypothetical protein